MKIFLSAVEQGPQRFAIRELIDKNVPMRWNLVSYYYARNEPELTILIRDHSEQILVDSGAHSFQHALQGNFKGQKKAKTVDWEAYTREYAAFIRDFDRPNVLGYFEMDIDGVVGYAEVLRLRKIIKRECGCPQKVIPVWHDNRGISEFHRMCEEHRGGIVAISGFRGFDIRDHQYINFLKTARRYGCRLHALGMTRKPILDKVPFDYVDSASWVMNAVYGRVGGRKVSRRQSKEKRTEVFAESYLHWQGIQSAYYRKWNGT